MKMEWFELASRSVVVLDQVNSFREESALQWGPVVGTTLRVVSSEAMASLEQQTPNAEEQNAVLPDEDRDPVYEEVYDLEKVFRLFPRIMQGPQKLQALMSAQGTLTVKKQAGGENRFNEEIDAIRSNLGEFRTNLGKLGISWVIRLLISVFLLIGLYYLYFI